MVSGGATTYYQKDHLSVRMTSDANGNVLGQQGTYPFGELWYSANGSSEWEFTTYQQDQETGLEYAMARYYDPRTATFCSADPVEGDPSDPESFNRYAYARNNPVILTDPSGQFFEFVVAFIVGAVLAAITGNPKFIPIVGVLGSIVFPNPGSTPPTFPGSGPTVTWKQLAIPGYNNVARFVVPFAPNTSFASGAGGGPQKKSPCTLPGRKRAFLSAHLKAAEFLGTALNTSPSNILGLAAQETGWGRNSEATVANNYFSLHVGPAYLGGSDGVYQAGNNPNLFFAYPGPDGFLNSGESFALSFQGARVWGAASPGAFAAALTTKPLAYNGHPGYKQDLVATIGSVQRCLHGSGGAL